MGLRRRPRVIGREPDGWMVMKSKKGGVKSVHPTREEAIEAARVPLADQGGGQIRVVRLDGRRPDRIKVKPNKKHATPVS